MILASRATQLVAGEQHPGMFTTETQLQPSPPIAHSYHVRSISLPCMSRELVHLFTCATEPGFRWSLEGSLYRDIEPYLIRLRHGILTSYCPGGRLCLLSASLEDWQTTQESPTRPTNATIDWQPSPGRYGQISVPQWLKIIDAYA
jgi:hypothetical protein